MSAPLPPTLGRYVVAADAAVRDATRLHDEASLERAREAVAVIRGVGALVANEQLTEVAELLLDALRVVAGRPEDSRAEIDAQLSVLVDALVDAAGGDGPRETHAVTQAQTALDALRVSSAARGTDAGPLQSALSTFNRDARAACAIPDDLARVDALLSDAHALRAAATELIVTPLERIAASLAALLAAHLAAGRPLDDRVCELLRVCSRILPAMTQHRSDLAPFQAPSEAIIKRAAELRQDLQAPELTAPCAAVPASAIVTEPAATVAHAIEARILTVMGERYLMCAADIEAISNAAAAVQRDGVDAPKVARLSDLVDAPGAASCASGMLVKPRETHWSMLVDDVSEPRHVTIQPLPRLLRSVSHARGAALLPDGSLALLLDSTTLLQHAVAVELAAPPRMAEDSATQTDRPVALIVDDAVSVRRRLGRTLQALGWECVQARDGIEALAALDERHVDLLITDLDMPRMDGAQLIQAARQRAGGTPPIVVLAPRHEQARLTATGVATDDHLLKPFRDDDVAALLQRLRLQVAGNTAR